MNSVPWSKLRRQLMLETDVPPVLLDGLTSFADLCGDPIGAYNKLCVLLKDKSHLIKDANEEIKQLLAVFKDFGVCYNIVLDPILVNFPNYYNSGVFFQIRRELRRKKPEVLAAGGRYDDLIENYKVPSSSLKKLIAVGVSFAVERIVSNTTIKKHQESVDVVVVSMGGKSTLTDRIRVVTDLWKHNIPAEYSMSTENHTWEQILISCKSNGYSWVVILKDKLNIRVRNIEKKLEADSISYAEIANVLCSFGLSCTKESENPCLAKKSQLAELFSYSDNQQELPYSSHNSFSNNIPSTIASLNVNVTIIINSNSPSKGKIPAKSPQKTAIIDRAIKALMHALAPGVINVGHWEILAHCSDRKLLMDICDGTVSNEEPIKRCKN